MTPAHQFLQPPNEGLCRDFWEVVTMPAKLPQFFDRYLSRN